MFLVEYLEAKLNDKDDAFLNYISVKRCRKFKFKYQVEEFLDLLEQNKLVEECKVYLLTKDTSKCIY
jgi:hypothetical protein